MTNLDALKALYAAIGGNPADVAALNSNTDVLNAIAAFYGAAESAASNAAALMAIAQNYDVPEPVTFPATLRITNRSGRNCQIGYVLTTVNNQLARTTISVSNTETVTIPSLSTQIVISTLTSGIAIEAVTENYSVISVGTLGANKIVCVNYTGLGQPSTPIIDINLIDSAES